MGGLRLHVPGLSLPQGNVRQRVRLVVTERTGGFPGPVTGGQEEVERFGNSVLAGEDGLDVPHHHSVQDGVHHHHAHTACQRETVV